MELRCEYEGSVGRRAAAKGLATPLIPRVMPIRGDQAAASCAKLKAATFACLLGLALTGGTSACTPAGVATGLHQDAATKIMLGMSSAAVFETLGAPLADTYDPRDETTRRLVYARVAVLSFGNNHLMWPGLACVVLLEDDAVVSADIIDSRRHLMCRCERESCPPDWSVPCLVSLPASGDTKG